MTLCGIHSSENYFTINVPESILHDEFDHNIFQIRPATVSGQWIKTHPYLRN